MKKENLILKIISRFILSVIVLMAVLFIPAGDLHYWPGWVFMGVILIPTTLVTIHFIKNDPELLRRRLHTKETVPEQKDIIKYGTVFFMIGFLIPGFDYRFHWSDISPAVIVIFNLITLIGYLIIFLVFRENSYASRIVEVEKGQKVISTGPYSLVRHPMYLGTLIMYMASPIALGSYWSIIAFLPIPVILVLRLLNEEKVLKKELPGYEAYCKIVTKHLIPYLW